MYPFSSSHYRKTILPGAKPDITRAKEWLGWEPTVPLKEGLVTMIEDFRTRFWVTRLHPQL